MGKGLGGLVVIVVIFMLGAWLGTKYPSVNLIAKVTG